MSSTSNSSAAKINLDTRGQEIDSLFQISESIGTGLDKRTLAILLNLIEHGVHPEALADILIEIRNMPIQSEFK